MTLKTLITKLVDFVMRGESSRLEELLLHTSPFFPVSHEIKDSKTTDKSEWSHE